LPIYITDLFIPLYGKSALTKTLKYQYYAIKMYTIYTILIAKIKNIKMQHFRQQLTQPTVMLDNSKINYNM